MSVLQNQAMQTGAVQVQGIKTTRKEDSDKGRSTIQGGEDGEGEGKAQAGGLLGGLTGENASVKPKKQRKAGGRANFKTGSKRTGETSGSRRSSGSNQTAQSNQTDAATQQRADRSVAQARSHVLASKAMGSQASLTQASVQFEQAQQLQQRQTNDGGNTNPLSAAGQRRQMLENLSRMVKIGLEQHTGGAAGEAYPRRETRQIFSALQGLKAGATKETGGGTATASNNTPSTRNVTNGEFALKEAKMNNVLAIFMDPPAPPEGHEPLELVA